MRGALLLPVLLAGVAALPAQQVPVRAGLGLVYAHRNFGEERDRELLVRVQAVGPDEIVTVSRWLDPKAPGTPVEEHVSRREMAGARNISFGRVIPFDTMGTRPRTIAMASQRLLRLLRTEGRAEASIPVTLDGGYTMVVAGTLTLASREPEVLELVVEGAPRKLRTLHARGTFANLVQGFRETGDWWFLDDTTDAWMVKHEGRDAGGHTFRMVLGAAGAEAGADGEAALDRALADACRAAVYGFYFATGSADLQPESAPTFRTVAAVLARHPDWRLTVEGHTDSIGVAAANRALAERRAAAVVRELTGRHGVAPGRLAPAGFGASRPVASNATLEGRARNRRVELVRACPAGR